MICLCCGEEFDVEMFSLCPFCGTEPEIEKTVAVEDYNDIHGEDENTDVLEGEQEIVNNVICDVIPNTPVENISNLNSFLLEHDSPDTEIHSVKGDSVFAEESEIANNSTNFMKKDVLVNIVFEDNKYTKFREYCDLQNIKYLSELENFDFERLKLFRGIGEKKVSEIRDRYFDALRRIDDFLLEVTSVEEIKKLERNTSISEMEIPIEVAFPGNEFNLMRRFCDYMDIKYISQLGDYEFECLKNYRGVGAGKFNRIRGRYHEILSEMNNFSPDVSVEDKALMIEDVVSKEWQPVERVIVPLYETVAEDISEQSIDILIKFGINSKTIRELHSLGFHDFDKLGKADVNLLALRISKNSLDKLKTLNDFVGRNVVQALSDKLDELSSEESYQYALLRGEGYTLQEVGEVAGKTRERIRQVVKKFNEKIGVLLWPIINKYILDKGYVTTQELLDIFDNDDYDKIVISWVKNSDELNYVNFADCYIPSNINVFDIRNDILDFAESFVGEGIELTEHYEEIEDEMQAMGYSFVTVDAFAKLLSSTSKYKLFNTYILPGYSYGQLLARIIAKHFPDGIKLYDKDALDKLRLVARIDYGVEKLTDNDRALSTRIAVFTVLRARGVVIAEENIYVEPELLDEIKAYIDESEETVIYYQELYHKFEGKLGFMSNIDNHYFLHGVLKLYFNDEYDFNDRDTFRKRGVETYTGKLQDKIANFIMEKGRPVTKSELKKVVPTLTEIMLSNLVSNDANIMAWNYGEIYLFNLLSISDENKQFLDDSIEFLLDNNDELISHYQLFDYVQTNNKNFLENNKITNSKSLKYVCMKMFKDKYSFKRVVIGKPGVTGNLDGKDAILYLLKNPVIFQYQDFVNLMERMKFKEGSIYKLFTDIKADYLQLNKDQYIQKTKFICVDDSIRKIEETIKSIMQNSTLSLIGFNRFDLLPDIGYEWSNHILRDIVDFYIPSLKTIDVGMLDRRYVKAIIVDATSGIATYEDFIVNMLTNEGLDSMSEKDLLSWLVLKNFTYKVIPTSLYNGENLKYKDGKFTLISNF